MGEKKTYNNNALIDLGWPFLIFKIIKTYIYEKNQSSIFFEFKSYKMIPIKKKIPFVRIDKIFDHIYNPSKII